jgi:hypothetical protein
MREGSLSTISDHLVRAGLVLDLSKGIPRTPSGWRTRITVEWSGHQSWEDIFTGNESWFYLNPVCNRIWLQRNEGKEDRELTECDVDGLLVPEKFFPDCGASPTANVSFVIFLRDRPTNLSHEVSRSHARKADFDSHGQCWSHQSKVTSDYLREFNFRPVPHPAFSPARSDSSKSVEIKTGMSGSEFGSAEELVSFMSPFPLANGSTGGNSGCRSVLIWKTATLSESFTKTHSP